MRQGKFNVCLLDLNHTTSGLHTSTMPLGIGLLAAYLKEKLPDAPMSISIHKFIDDLYASSYENRLNVIGFSMYSWNTNLNLAFAKKLKEKNPKAIVVCGGPNINYSDGFVARFLRANQFIDYVIPFNAEIPMLGIVTASLQGHLSSGQPIPGAYSLTATGDEVFYQEELRRLTSLSEVPSPYLGGIMDKFFPEREARYKLSPFIETNRGCPYRCSFCHTAHGIYNKLLYKDIDVIKDEIELFATRLKKFPDIPLYIADNNFGMLNRDNEIADIIRSSQDRHGWPRFIDTTIGKSRVDNILGVTKRMHPGTVSVTMSTQSMTPMVLEKISRKNLPIKDFLRFQEEISRENESTGHRNYSQSELIIGLPGETKETFYSSVEKVIGLGIDMVIPYTLMVLKGTPLGEQIYAQRDKYDLRYRIVPKQFGQYSNELIIDTEEVAVATPTMAFEDYLECRALSFFLQVVYKNDIFDVPVKLLRRSSLNVFLWLIEIMDRVRTSQGALRHLFDNFLMETKQELWASETDLNKFFSQAENYTALKDGRYGENLLAKYVLLAQLDAYDQLIEIGHSVTKDMLFGSGVDDVFEYLEEYFLYCRRVKRIPGLIESDEALAPFSLQVRFDFTEKVDNDWQIKESPRLIFYEYSETAKSIIMNLKEDEHWRFRLQQFLRLQGGGRVLYPIAKSCKVMANEAW